MRVLLLLARTSGKVWLLTAIVILVTVLVLPFQANAITFGTIDDTHTYAGAVIFPFTAGFGPGILWCSGSLVSPRVFATAAHCTDFLISSGITPDQVFVSFATNILEDRKSWRAVSSYMNHPDYLPPPFIGGVDTHDIGVVILAKAVKNIKPATLAPIGYLDTLAAQGKLRDAKFAVIGYGVDINLEADGSRKIAFSEFLNLHDAFLYMSQNPNTGDSGTCFGDSGGPTIYNDGTTEFQVAITTWGDAICIATGINYRIDTQTSLSFIQNAIAANP